MENESSKTIALHYWPRICTLSITCKGTALASHADPVVDSELINFSNCARLSGFANCSVQPFTQTQAFIITKCTA